MSAYIGVDLAWGLGTATRPPNETGLAATDPDGTIVDAGWARGVDDVVQWVERHLDDRTLVAVDASLVVTNPTGIREPERQVAQRYGRWKVAANPTNLASAASAGARLLDALTDRGVVYLGDTAAMRGRSGPGMFECYPYTTLVGVAELGHDVERPRYKRLDTRIAPAEARARRAVAFDALVRTLSTAPLDPPLRLASHPTTRALAEPSGLHGPTHKHREDLLDGVLCAWTAAFWDRWGDERVQILGRDPSLPADLPDHLGRRPAIVAPARPEQRGRR